MEETDAGKQRKYASKCNTETCFAELNPALGLYESLWGFQNSSHSRSFLRVK